MSTDTTWHFANDRDNNPECVHCTEGPNGGHYVCTENNPCQDCLDDALTASENVASGYGPNGEDTGAEYDSAEYVWEY